MKINLTVEVDWIEEDGNIDEEIKNELIHGVKAAISKTCMKNMEEQSTQAFDEAVKKASEKITEKAIKFAEDWLDNEVEITDKWGDVETKLTIKDLIKRSFDNLLEKKVDAKGNFTTDNYGTKTKLIDYLTNKKVEAEVSERLKHFGKDIDKRIEDTIEQGIKDNVSNRFAQMVIGAAKQDYLDQQAITDEPS